MKRVIYAALLMSTQIALASGDGHGSVTDLIAPFVNVTILVSFLVWKLKGPAQNFFHKKSTTVSEIVERASNKAKEAEMLLKINKQKNDGLVQELTEIEKEVHTVTSQFKEEMNVGLVTKISDLKKDAAQRIESEKQEILNGLSLELVNAVIKNAKTAVTTNKDLNNKITKNISEGIN